MQDPETELTRDIGYALARSPFKVKGQPIETLRLVAAGVVAHLRLSGWLFTLRSPEPMHGPASGPQPDGQPPDTCGADGASGEAAASTTSGQKGPADVRSDKPVA